MQFFCAEAQINFQFDKPTEVVKLLQNTLIRAQIKDLTYEFHVL